MLKLPIEYDETDETSWLKRLPVDDLLTVQQLSEFSETGDKGAFGM